MDWLTFFAEIAKALSWPVVVVALFYIMREPLAGLIKLIVKIKYKDLEVWFSKEVARIKSGIDEKAEIVIDEDSDIKKLCNDSPVKTIIDTWNDLESITYSKLKELFPASGLQAKRLTKARAFAELQLTGVLSPSYHKLLQDLSLLRNTIVHSPEFSISGEDAYEYISLIIQIKQEVESLTELPAVKLTPFTTLIGQINHLIDTGSYSEITKEDIYREIKTGQILRFLKSTAKGEIDLSIILDGTTYPSFEQYYIETLQGLIDAYDENDIGVRNSGLCLLLALTNQIIQMGSGWHPMD